MAQMLYKAGLQYMSHFFAQRNDQFTRYDGADLFTHRNPPRMKSALNWAYSNDGGGTGG